MTAVPSTWKQAPYNTKLHNNYLSKCLLMRSVLKSSASLISQRKTSQLSLNERNRHKPRRLRLRLRNVTRVKCLLKRRLKVALARSRGQDTRRNDQQEKTKGYLHLNEDLLIRSWGRHLVQLLSQPREADEAPQGCPLKKNNWKSLRSGLRSWPFRSQVLPDRTRESHASPLAPPTLQERWSNSPAQRNNPSTRNKTICSSNSSKRREPSQAFHLLLHSRNHSWSSRKTYPDLS